MKNMTNKKDIKLFVYTHVFFILYFIFFENILKIIKKTIIKWIL